MTWKGKNALTFFCFSISEWCLVFPCTLTSKIPLSSILKVLHDTSFTQDVHDAENSSLTTEFIQLTWLSQCFLYVLYLVLILSISAELYYFSTFL